jgi:hypothetical protein
MEFIGLRSVMGMGFATMTQAGATVMMDMVGWIVPTRKDSAQGPTRIGN